VNEPWVRRGASLRKRALTDCEANVKETPNRACVSASLRAAVVERRLFGTSCYIKDDPLPGALNNSGAIYRAVKWEIEFQTAGFAYRL
jgi:hypothetical protein